MRCQVKPYEGELPYIFFSYCHRDAAEAYSIIEMMAKNGYRIWYDDGIHPGDDWTETIAARIGGCTACVAAVSPRSAASLNCRNEINFSLEHAKTLIPVLLEDFPMPSGMRLQLCSCQHIRKYDLPDEQEFLRRLSSAAGLTPCRTTAVLSTPDAQGSSRDVLPTLNAQERGNAFLPTPDAQGNCKTVLLTPNTQDDDKTVLLTPDAQDNGKNTVPTLPGQSEPEQIPAALITLCEKCLYPLPNRTAKIGRNSGSCDIVLKNRTVSSVHAEIRREASGYSLCDLDSANGTSVNGTALTPGQPMALQDGALLLLGAEACLFVMDKTAAAILTQRQIAVLECKETGEYLPLSKNTFPLGRANAWPGGTFHDRRASRSHGEIRFLDGHYVLVVETDSTNGTFLNGRRLSAGTKTQLLPDDEIRIGTVYHIHLRRTVLEMP